jgi:hypothetical protein
MLFLRARILHGAGERCYNRPRQNAAEPVTSIDNGETDAMSRSFRSLRNDTHDRAQPSDDLDV